MAILATLSGAGLILIALRDVFHTLFRPSGRGSISELLPKAIWQLVFRRFAARHPTALVLSGPTALLAVLVSWSALLAVGWTLIYWPHLPGRFLFSAGLDPSANGGFFDALYLSLATLTTLGYGDITPTSGWLRLLAATEALIGFGFLTAGISWVLSIYPALSRRRALAHEISLIRDAESETGIDAKSMDAEAAGRMLGGLAAQLISVRTDLIQFPITYYFHSDDGRNALSATIPYLARLVEEYGAADYSPAGRLRTAVLRGAINDLSSVVASRFLDLPSTSVEKILAAYARDHYRKPPAGGEPGRR
jgi:hypothetical protein